MTYDEILSHLQVKKRYQDKAQCQCPAHDDRQASLTVTNGRDSVLIHCHAGCDIDNVLSAAGLKKSDLKFFIPTESLAPYTNALRIIRLTIVTPVTKKFAVFGVLRATRPIPTSNLKDPCKTASVFWKQKITAIIS